MKISDEGKHMVSENEKLNIEKYKFTEEIVSNNSDELYKMVSEILDNEFPELKNNSLIHDLVLYRVKTIQTLENVLSCIKEVDVKESQNGEMLTCSI